MNDPSRIMHGDKALYGASVGILMLEARFPRIPGDMGNALTWPFPVLYKVVPGASPHRVVVDRARGLLDAFLAAAAELVRLGADGITTTCGFLSLYQREISAHVGVPVATSSLMQIPLIERVLPPGKRVGIVTISAPSLTREHLVAAGADPETPVIGTDAGSEFTRVILNDEQRLDVAAAERDILDAGDALLAQHPETGAVLLECTNMCHTRESCPSGCTCRCSASTILSPGSKPASCRAISDRLAAPPEGLGASGGKGEPGDHDPLRDGRGLRPAARPDPPARRVRECARRRRRH